MTVQLGRKVFERLVVDSWSDAIRATAAVGHISPEFSGNSSIAVRWPAPMLLDRSEGRAIRITTAAAKPKVSAQNLR